MRARPRLVRRLVQLYAGLVACGFSMALMIQSDLGVMPWDVLHQALARTFGLTVGTVVIAVGALALALWLPLRERPGLGTVSNVVVIGVAVDASLAVLPDGLPLAARVAMGAAGVVVNGLATAAYIGVAMGPGPRDGLMTGLARRTGRPVRAIRTAIEVVVVGTGWLLGGTVGVVTVVYALGVGPLVQAALPVFTVRDPHAEPPTR